MSYDTIKTSLISILNGGLACDLNDDYTNKIRKEIKGVHDFVITQHPDEYKDALKLVKKRN